MILCSKNPLSWQRHNKEDIKTAFDKLEAKYPTAIRTVEDLAAVYDMDKAGDDHLTENNSNCKQRAEQEAADMDDTA